MALPALRPLSKVHVSLTEPGGLEFDQQLLAVAAQKIQRFRLFGADMRMHAIPVAVQGQPHTAKFLRGQRKLDPLFGRCTGRVGIGLC